MAGAGIFIKRNNVKTSVPSTETPYHGNKYPGQDTYPNSNPYPTPSEPYPNNDLDFTDGQNPYPNDMGHPVGANMSKGDLCRRIKSILMSDITLMKVMTRDYLSELKEYSSERLIRISDTLVIHYMVNGDSKAASVKFQCASPEYIESVYAGIPREEIMNVDHYIGKMESMLNKLNQIQGNFSVDTGIYGAFSKLEGIGASPVISYVPNRQFMNTYIKREIVRANMELEEETVNKY